MSVENLNVSFVQNHQTLRAVRGISFSIETQKTLGIVGESGCGKSVTALSLMRLLPPSIAAVTAQRLLFDEIELSALPESEMRRVRGNRIAMVFQDPMTALNPLFTCGDQIAEAIVLHRNVRRAEAMARSVELLDNVGIAAPAVVAARYPHQLSGGMRQRVVIAMALACRPMLLIADEPTTALDVTVQAKIIDLLLGLQQELRMSMIMITHDLGIVSAMAHDVLVMYAGEVMENAAANTLFSNPLHPYTKSLLASIPTIERKQARLTVIPGEVPNPHELPSGCPFHPRCYARMERCRTQHPALYTPQTSHQVRCLLYE
ncbi:MAG: ABC transporter ATP-binding protein [Chitinivibrionales bacterium]|nr:ABC transporter ATP-binding protein [Chitinivibrionales bacterium]